MPKPLTRAQIERLAILLPEEQKRLLAIYQQEQAELNDKEERKERKMQKLNRQEKGLSLEIFFMENLLKKEQKNS